MQQRWLLRRHLRSRVVQRQWTRIARPTTSVSTTTVTRSSASAPATTARWRAAPVVRSAGNAAARDQTCYFLGPEVTVTADVAMPTAGEPVTFTAAIYPDLETTFKWHFQDAGGNPVSSTANRRDLHADLRRGQLPGARRLEHDRLGQHRGGHGPRVRRCRLRVATHQRGVSRGESIQCVGRCRRDQHGPVGEGVSAAARQGALVRVADRAPAIAVMRGHSADRLLRIGALARAAGHA